MDKFDVKILPTKWGETPQDALDYLNKDDKIIIDRLMNEPRMNRQPEVFMQCTVPNEFQNPGKYNIGITAGVETTVCPPEWIDGMNRMDLNIVPSEFVKGMFNSLKFTEKGKDGNVTREIEMQKPIEVLFEGADTDIYKKINNVGAELKAEMSVVKESFAFLFVGHWLQGGLGNDRKDLGMLIRTFFDTFKNKAKAPALILKTSGSSFSILDREMILAKIEQIKASMGNNKLPNIYVLHGDLTDVEMNELYNHPKVKAHVTFTHGEGFGRPLLEAVFSEKPIIAPKWSGHLDFLHEKHTTLLPGGLVKVPKDGLQNGLVVDGAHWFTVDYGFASKILKDVFDSYNKYTKSAKVFSLINKGKFSMDAMTIAFENVLDKYLPVFTTEANLVLPKLKKKGGGSPKMKLPTLKKTTDSKMTAKMPKLKKVTK
jgi:hypothetical protein